jgi:hypothetical protein
VLLILVLAAGVANADDYIIDADHPRIVLNARRLRLIQRERERESIRWQQFQLLMQGKARMPEPGFAKALYYRASGDEAAGREAVSWAVSASDLHQIAIAYDWCQPVMSDADRTVLERKLKTATAQTAKTASGERDLTLAAIALGDAAALTRAIDALSTRIKAGNVDRKDVYPLYEAMHAIRDNVHLDLRERAVDLFKVMPGYHVLSHYPASYPAAENEYRIPVYAGASEPNLDDAAMSRVAELAMVAYDTNAQDSQFLQGWLMHDRFLLRGTLGAPYEFLWANPYQPGLSYYHMPLVFHDPARGRLIVRSSWEEDATWFGQLDGVIQVFRDGKIIPLKAEAQSKPLQVGSVEIVFPRQAAKFSIDGGAYYIVGLAPNAAYDVEVDDEELRELRTDAGGILELTFTEDRKAGVRLRRSPQ